MIYYPVLTSCEFFIIVEAESNSEAYCVVSVYLIWLRHFLTLLPNKAVISAWWSITNPHNADILAWEPLLEFL